MSNAVLLIVDDGSIFLGPKIGGIFFHDVQQKQGQNDFSDWEFPDALPSLTSLSESLNLLSASEVSKFYFNH